MDIEQKISNLRQKAEARLRLKAEHQGQSRADDTSVDELLRELEIHQAELEIQNEELHTINSQLSKTEAHFRDLYERAPVPYFTLDRRGTILDLNLAAGKLLWAEVDSIKGTHLTRLCAQEDADKLHRFLFDLKETKEPKSCELRIVRCDGHDCDVLLQGLQVGNGPDELRIAAVDLTERKRAEKAESWLSSLVTASDDAIIGLDPHGRITSWNPGATSMLGYSAEEVANESITGLLGVTGIQGLSPLADAIRGARSCHDVNVVCVTKDDRQIQITITLSPMYQDGKLQGFALLARDVTEARRLESEVLSIAEREERRFGRDLHDSLGQQLSGARFAIDSLVKRLRRTSPELAEETKKIAGMVGQALEEARGISHGYALSLLESEGLLVALDKLGEHTRDYSQAECRCRFDEDAKVEDLTVATHLYRIAQEAVNNALRHGHAKEIEIELTGTGHSYQLTIRDDGIGMGPDPHACQGMGLRVMQYRADMMHGTLEVQNRPGGGTIITCKAPCPPPAAQDNPEDVTSAG